MNKRILVVSSANIDFVQRTATVPEAGETVVSNDKYAYIPGGKGANSAVTFARLGDDCVFCARVGQDSNGKRLKEIYEKEHIDTRYMAFDTKASTGLASIIVDGEGQNRIIVYPGANLKMTAEDVEEAFNCYPDAVYMQFEIPDKAILTAAKLANERKIPLYVDAGPARTTFPLEQLGQMEVFSPNETETIAYTGIEPTNGEGCLRAAIRLSSIVKAKYIVLKLGNRGSYIYDGKYYHFIPTVPVTVMDTTGAGDIFTAALTHFCLDGKDIEEAAYLANCAASISVSREGAYASIPTLKDTLAFREDHPMR